MKKILMILVLLIGTFSLTGCDEKEKDYHIYEGMVVDKIFDEGYTYTTFVKSGSAMIPIHHHVPDKYYLVIYKDEKIDKHQVEKEFYDTFTIGSHITIGEENIVEESE